MIESEKFYCLSFFMVFFYILSIFLGVWLVSLSAILYKLLQKFNQLTAGVREDLSKKGFAEVGKRLDFLEKDSESHIQKIGLVKYNPFREVGGEYSFSLAMLDKGNTGVILTCLHTRDSTRIYIKDVKKGKSRLELSEEEKKAFLEAQKRNN